MRKEDKKKEQEKTKGRKSWVNRARKSRKSMKKKGFYDDSKKETQDKITKTNKNK